MEVTIERARMCAITGKVRLTNGFSRTAIGMTAVVDR